MPSFLGPRLYVNFSNDGEYQAKLVELAKELHGLPAVPKPPIGPNPFSETPVEVVASKVVRDAKFLDDDWFAKEQAIAQKGLLSVGLIGSMELRIGILSPLSKSQIELLNAVRQAEIHTFGWPIGITLEIRDEYRPRPYGDGIRAEVPISDSGLKSRSYLFLQAVFFGCETKG